MVDGIRPAIDPLGLGRLSETLRQGRLDEQNRQLQQQQAVTRGLQQELLGGQVQQQRQSLADLAEKSRIKNIAFEGSQINPASESDIAFRLKVYKDNNRQDLYDDLFDATDKRIKSISVQSPKAGADLFNRDLAPALGIDPIEYKADTNFGPAFQVIDPNTKQTKLMVQDKNSGEFKDAGGLEGLQLVDKSGAGSKFQLKEGLDSSGKKTFFTFDPNTGIVPEGIRPLPEKGEIIESLPGGGFKITRGDVGGARQKKFTEVESKSGGFADRVLRSNNILNELEDTPDFEPALISETIAASIPLVGNALLSPEKQRYEQAKRDFVTAVLRLESGAAINDSEFVREDKKFFPQVGDSQEVIKQKRESRSKQFDILKAGSAGAFEAIQQQRESNIQGSAPKISTVEQFNALPSGTIYQQEDGQTFQKP